jgi:decaprenylphospho-beta-D-erythro-pentofuranosid-2-ulose 2-reductase
MTLGPVLILGARSDIGRAVAHVFAARGHPVQLAARDIGRLADDQSDIALRYGVPVSLHTFDALALDTHAEFVAGLPALPDIAICAVGLMGAQGDDPAQDMLILRSNFEGPASILSALAVVFSARGHGTLIGISSVAGLRGRASNYVYGSAKAGFTAFLSGLRNRLARRGVHVVTVLPGFVATGMTDGMALPPSLTAQPDEVASAILRAVTHKKNIIYVRRIWWAIMLVIRLIPEPVFKRLHL